MTKDEMDQATQHLGTKSAKIRALAGLGVARSEIAKFLGIKYQHVRNVLVQPAPARGDTPPLPTAPRADVPAAWEVARKAADVADEEKFVADEGAVILRYPGILASASIDELEEFFAFVIKRARRRAAKRAETIKQAGPVLYPDVASPESRER